MTLERRKREAGDLDIEDKLEKIVDEIKGIKQVNDDVVDETIRDKVRASEKDLRMKVKTSMSCLKLIDFDFRESKNDRTKMSKMVTRELK